MEKDYTQRIEQITLLARGYGWQQIAHDYGTNMLSFKRKGERINVWYSKMTVSTAIKHPIKGFTQLYRKRVSTGLLEAIFNDPRVHTRKGYMRKGENNWQRWA